jgi:toxin-antitoxin system PIN domain toxin
VLAAFLRIVTNPRIFERPTPMDTAIAFCPRLVDWPRASLIAPSRRHWDVFVSLCSGVRGPLVADAYIAALAIDHGCELITTDGDFARFPGLRWRHPLAASRQREQARWRDRRRSRARTNS